MTTTPNNPAPHVGTTTDRLLRPEEAAALLGVSTRFLRSQRAAGRITALRLSYKCVRYAESEVARYASALPAQATQADR